jgi:hypothetical protein
MKLQAKQRLLAAMDSWAKEMFNVIKKIDPKIDGGIGGMGSSDYCYVSVSTAKKIVDALSKAGYKKTGTSFNSTINLRSNVDKSKGVGLFKDEDEDEIQIFWFDEHL